MVLSEPESSVDTLSLTPSEDLNLRAVDLPGGGTVCDVWVEAGVYQVTQ